MSLKKFNGCDSSVQHICCTPVLWINATFVNASSLWRDWFFELPIAYLLRSGHSFSLTRKIHSS